MNLLANPLNDAQKVWNTVKGGSGKSSNSSALAKSASPDGDSTLSSQGFCFVTPNLIALGKFNERKLDDLFQALGNKKLLFWNLSGKSMHPTILSKLRYQLMDIPWLTPGQFTQAPSLECVFVQCYALRSWLDMSPEHVAIVHCTNGRSRTGILISCFLKYIGAFSSSSNAFDFFCGTRVQLESTPPLNPSYRILFENIDRAIDMGQYPNSAPIRLKCVSLSSIPVEDIPCVEVWDRRGLVFSSHTGYSATDKCGWSTDFGDGFFKVNSDIIGDFSVLCRFGGSHAMTRDKTTLIFRYQNSTAFLPSDVVELKKLNVDVNPEYSDSLDQDTFAMHLMFEPSDVRSLEGNNVLDVLYTYPRRGKEAFEAGLDEVSKTHVIEPEPSKFSQLVGHSAAGAYSTVALQLSSNEVNVAMKLMTLMAQRSADLSSSKVEKNLSPAAKVLRAGGTSGNNSPGIHGAILLRRDSDDSLGSSSANYRPSTVGVSQSGTAARKHMQQTFTEGGFVGVDSELGISSSRSYSPKQRTGGGLSPVPYSRSSPSLVAPGHTITQSSPASTAKSYSPKPNSGAERPSLAALDPNSGNVLTSAPTMSSSVDDSSACRVCNTNDYAKRDQIISCTECKSNYHTHCSGNRRIPFTIKSKTERESRNKYIQKYYGQWICLNCTANPTPSISRSPVNLGVHTPNEKHAGESVESPITPVIEEPDRNKTAPANVQWIPKFQPSGGVAFSSMSNAAGVAESNVTVSTGHQATTSAIPMIGGTSSPKSGTKRGSFSGASALASFIRNKNNGPVVTTPVASARNIPEKPVITTSLVTSNSPAVPESQNQKGNVEEANKLLNALMAKGYTMESLATLPPHEQAKILAAAMTNAAPEILPPPPGVGGTSNLKNGRSPINSGKSPMNRSSVSNQTAVGGNPQLVKYQKMLSLGLSNDSVIKCMLDDGLDPILMPEFSNFSPNSTSPAETPSASAISSNIGGSGAPVQGVAGGPILVDNKYVKYLNMIKVGIPRLPMALKMVAEGVCATKEEALSIIDGSTQNPSLSGKPGDPPPGDQALWYVAGSQANDKFDPLGRSTGGGRGIGGGVRGIGEVESQDGGAQMMYKDHPIYGKYFKMIKAGLPDVAVKAKMDADGVDSSVLSRNPTDFVTSKTGVEAAKIDNKVEIQNHPLYSKYFKMLKVGLPRVSIQAKMQEDGADPSKLDLDPQELIPLSEKEEKKEAENVSIAEHPKYAKYFKMMKVGLSKEVVQGKMTQDGIDPAILDKNPDEKIPLADATKDEMVALKDHPKYAKYFKMLKVGLPRPQVEAKMKQEDIDPTILDRNPDEQVPLNEKKIEKVMVELQSHPKYAKYFKMLKVGLPKPQVEAKMKQEGIDPAILDRNPTELVAENEDITVVVKAPEIKKKPAEKVRKKKLHWKALEKVEADSVWATGDGDKDDYNLDMDEFQVLFSEKREDPDKPKEAKPTAVVKRNTVVNLIDPKRGQNAGIALARIKFTFIDLKQRIRCFNATGLSTDQLRSLEEYLPTEEERKIIVAYTGDKEQLGKAENYMYQMSNLPGAGKRIQSMLFRQVFPARLNDIKITLDKISEACNDVKLSERLRKVLKAILKIGNQINDGETHAGFTLDSLLKLQTAKAYDKKTSVLQYIITVIYKNDPGILMFPEDLSNVDAASRVQMESVVGEIAALRTQYDTVFKVVEDVHAILEAKVKKRQAVAHVLVTEEDKKEDSLITVKETKDEASIQMAKKEAEEKETKEAQAIADEELEFAGVAAMKDFLNMAKQQLDGTEKNYNDTKTKYQSVLSYFAADNQMASHDFFSTFARFVQSFVETRDAVERQRKSDEKKALLAASKDKATASDNSGASVTAKKVPMRRSSAIVTSSSQSFGKADNDLKVEHSADDTNVSSPEKHHLVDSRHRGLSVHTDHSSSAVAPAAHHVPTVTISPHNVAKNTSSDGVSPTGKKHAASRRSSAFS